ncbi:Putative prolyl 4-hydroxylase, alpha subunit [Septoria linicola]|uniref:Prolyl 4-hydroxylase, alpha subunit n=1 Tax=Septoria linicola TaxID=215465 RepID=A0A9Q9AJS4_9PEZI|nr:putative prolyl 4-hydroxylase, alpha subunit [Septoria linicola]USW49194.1 Putative prolyl 4-hydroxylase, alpha subunit [Septoria linicola]
MAPKAKSAKKGVVATGPKEEVCKPDWPPLKPLLPAYDLTFETLLPDQILTIPRFWTSSLCNSYVSFLSSLPLTTTPGKPKKGDAVRVNDRFQVDDASFAEQLWSGTALKDLVTGYTVDGIQLNDFGKDELWGGEVVGLNPNIRIYRYSKGQFFDQHFDESNNISFPSADSVNPIPAKTTWTLLLYLTSPATGCEGGETVFYPEPPSKRDTAPPPVIADLDVGMALLHRHGKECILHEGREVTAGEKWVIRSDLCVRR